MNHKELYYFAGKCLTIDEHPEIHSEIKDKISSSNFNVELFIKLCSNHYILPAIYIKFRNHGILNLFEKELAGHLEYIYQQNLLRNEQILGQINEINKSFSHSGISPVYLKGAAHLLDNLYLDKGERIIGDIDVLVKQADFIKAAEVIMSLGYQNNIPVYSNLNKLKHYPRLFKTGVPADIEIHRLPVNKEYSKNFTSEMIFAERKEIANTLNCFVPADSHKIIHNFIHSQLSNKGYRFCISSLRDLYDLYRLSQRIKLTETLNLIEKCNKAESYFFFTGKVFGLNEIYSSINNKKVLRHYQLKTYLIKHKRLHRFLYILYMIFNLIFVRYLFKIIRAVFFRSDRDYIYRRIKDIRWYKIHFQGLQKYFR